MRCVFQHFNVSDQAVAKIYKSNECTSETFPCKLVEKSIKKTEAICSFAYSNIEFLAQQLNEDGKGERRITAKHLPSSIHEISGFFEIVSS